MSARILALAGGAIVAMLAAPAAADPCSEFRLALALEDAASKVEAEALRALTQGNRGNGRGAEAGAEHVAAFDALREATERVESAMIAVRRTVADETAALIDALHAAREAVSRAQGAFVGWMLRVKRTEGLMVPSVRVYPAYTAVDRAYRDSVKAVCAFHGRL